ncbi:sulfotransferase family 2 domain-containing protein [Vibrio astriarenae]|uniref:sulfotransferase family 2 domain-containing protein n=1 Tax=Vibrio astriarenae TaxID=1481923 RepID=UPI00373506B6
MTPTLASFALRLIPKKQQHTMLARALDYLLDVQALQEYVGKVLAVSIRDSKLSWSLLFDGQSFVHSRKTPDLCVQLSLDDVLNFPSSEELRLKIMDGSIEVAGQADDQQFILQLTDSIDQLKITACLRRLRGLLGIKAESIQDKPLPDLTIRDVGSEQDVNYLRDQAVKHESSDPALAYSLMRLAHGARPKGPFIKRKLNSYRSQGFDRLFNQKQAPLQVIPVSQELGYFPMPKTACSSVKLALYEQKYGVEYDKARHEERHVHEYWSREMVPMASVSNSFIVVRDPIERFLSAYANRVMDHRELHPNAIKRACPWLAQTLPQFKPNLTQFIRHLEHYMLVPTIEHHCQPLSWQVNHDLTQFSQVIPLENIGAVQQLLQQATKSKIKIPKAHKGKNTVGLDKLNEEQLEKLLQFYADDYALLSPWYSEDAVREKWLLAKQKSS